MEGQKFDCFSSSKSRRVCSAFFGSKESKPLELIDHLLHNACYVLGRRAWRIIKKLACLVVLLSIASIFSSGPESWIRKLYSLTEKIRCSGIARSYSSWHLFDESLSFNRHCHLKGLSNCHRHLEGFPSKLLSNCSRGLQNGLGFLLVWLYNIRFFTIGLNSESPHPQ